MEQTAETAADDVSGLKSRTTALEGKTKALEEIAFKYLPDVKDANSALTPGMQGIGSGVANTPCDWGILVVFRTGNYVAQMFFAIAAGVAYVRMLDISKGASAFTKWVQI